MSKCLSNPSRNYVFAIQYRNVPQAKSSHFVLAALIFRCADLQQSVIHQTTWVSDELPSCIWNTHLATYTRKTYP